MTAAPSTQAGLMNAMAITENGGPDALAATRVSVPTRLGSEVLVRVVAASVNRADLDALRGRGAGVATAAAPLVLGHDFSGVVVEGPYDAHPLKPGHEVFGMTMPSRSPGCYAEYVTVPAQSVARKPVGLSHVEAAAFPMAALTAWGLVVDVAMTHQGQRILIQAGAGGVGHFAVQFAAYFGAHVIATGAARNASWLRQLGAAEVVDRSVTDLAANLAPVAVAINLVDDEDVALHTLEAVQPGGLFVHVPTSAAPKVAAAAAAAGVRFTDFAVVPDAAALAIIARLADEGDVSVYIDDVYDLAEVADAHRALEQRHTRGKLVLRVADEDGSADLATPPA